MNVPILGKVVDERFLEHRLRSTSVGGIAGAMLAGGLFLYHYFARHEMRWDLFAVIATMAAVKWGVLLWYRRTN
jgi:hypothetical protein